MTNFGFAPTQDIPRLPVTRTATTAVPALRTVTAPAPGTIRPGTLVGYHGSSVKDHGDWVCDGPCACSCGGLQLWRYRRDGLHRLEHVSPYSVTGGFRP